MRWGFALVAVTMGCRQGAQPGAAPVGFSSGMAFTSAPAGPQGQDRDAGRSADTLANARDAHPIDDRFARVLPGADEPTYGERRGRKRTAVLLIAAPGSASTEAGIVRVESLRFEAVLCSIGGRAVTGSQCGEVMPARATVHITDAVPSGGNELEVTRSMARAPDWEGHRLAPPYAPVCCGDNACVGKTIPYRPVADSHDALLTNTRTILGVWPKDADIGLIPAESGISSDVKIGDAPWTQRSWRARGGNLARVDRPLQAFARDGRRYASVGFGLMDGAVFVDTGSGWREAFKRFAVEYLLATSDVDGDGRPELLVYEAWVNGYGLDLLINDETEPAYHFSCGNI